MILNGLMGWMMKPLQYSRGGSVLKRPAWQLWDSGNKWPRGPLYSEAGWECKSFFPPQTPLSAVKYSLCCTHCALAGWTSRARPIRPALVWGEIWPNSQSKSTPEENVFQDMPAENFKDYFFLSLFKSLVFWTLTRRSPVSLQLA